jgi:cell division septation protein DedD
MKWIIYALLLANLAFALWHYRSQELTSVNPPSAEDDNLRLVLVKEFLSQHSKPPPVGQASEAESTARCYTLGPFKGVDEANAVRDELKSAGITAKRRMIKDNSRKGFWVLLPPESSRSQARQNIDLLKEKGIKDYFLVVTGEQTNAVSLGVFAQTDTAQRRFEEIKAMGFNPKIQNVDLPLREYWLDWPAEQTLSPDALDKIRKQYNSVGQTQRACSSG